jgi:phenylpropionate dioxygenase-like ring-hydroxylating dioxygenase large terminal subunit
LLLADVENFMDKMSRVALAGRIDRLLEAKTTDMASEPYKQPTSVYVDPEWLAIENEVLFRGKPIVLGVAKQIPEPGDFFTVDIGNLPLLVVRGMDNRIRTMLNICRHRGNRLCKASSGRKRVFTCSFHSWSFDTSGNLKSFVDNDAFSGQEKDDFQLKELPTEERYGLIWCQTEVGGTLDLDSFVTDALDGELSSHEIDKYHFYKAKSFDMPFNWKLGVDTFLEVFHLAHLHRATVAPLFIGNTATWIESPVDHRP